MADFWFKIRIASPEERKQYKHNPEYIITVTGGELDGYECGVGEGVEIGALVEHIVKQSLFRGKKQAGRKTGEL